MTHEALLRRRLEKALQMHGEDAFSVRQLRAQLASALYFKKVKPALGTEEFHIGARGEASEDLQPGEYQEDMYGNPIMSTRREGRGRGGEEAAGGGAIGGVSQSSGSPVNTLRL